MLYTLRWEGALIHAEFAQDCPFTAHVQASNEVTSDPRFPSLRYVIWDSSRSHLTSIERKDVEALAAVDVEACRANPNLKVALVPSDSITRKVAEIFVALSGKLGSSWRFEVFDDLPSARVWAYLN